MAAISTMMRITERDGILDSAIAADWVDVAEVVANGAPSPMSVVSSASSVFSIAGARAAGAATVIAAVLTLASALIFCELSINDSFATDTVAAPARFARNTTVPNSRVPVKPPGNPAVFITVPFSILSKPDCVSENHDSANVKEIGSTMSCWYASAAFTVTIFSAPASALTARENVCPSSMETEAGEKLTVAAYNTIGENSINIEIKYFFIPLEAGNASHFCLNILAV